MCIYQIKPITQKILERYRPTRLAIKELAGQLYFCKSIVEDIETYPGSGVVWQKRIKKYGKQNIKTLWVSDWYHDPYEIQQVALHFSKENQVVESSKWANQKPEDGLDGGRQSPETQAVITKKIRGQKRTPEQNEAKSKRQTGLRKPQHWIDTRPGYDKTLYRWEFVETGEVVTMIRRDFRKQYIDHLTKLKNQTVREMITTGKTIFGWRWMDYPDEVLTPFWKCQHCGKEGENRGLFTRWHGDKCKLSQV
jgi:hypothetical protein